MALPNATPHITDINNAINKINAFNTTLKPITPHNEIRSLFS